MYLTTILQTSFIFHSYTIRVGVFFLFLVSDFSQCLFSLYGRVQVYCYAGTWIDALRHHSKTTKFGIHVGFPSWFHFSVFSMSTALRVAIQVNQPINQRLILTFQILRAVGELHALGFLHRFLRPQSFSIGLGSKIRTIYFADFGSPYMVWFSSIPPPVILQQVQFRDPKTKKIRKPRKHIRVIGTLRYVRLLVGLSILQSFILDVEKFPAKQGAWQTWRFGGVGIPHDGVLRFKHPTLAKWSSELGSSGQETKAYRRCL